MLSKDSIFGNSDGIIDPDKYWDHNGLKILWLLKESYGEGGVDQALQRQKAQAASEIFDARNTDGFSTFGPIIRLANILQSQESDDPYTSPGSWEHFKTSTSYVNIKKIPGISESKPKEIEAAFHENASMLEEQVSLYSPNVIIGGHTLGYLLCRDRIPNSSSFFEEIKRCQGNGPKYLTGIDYAPIFGDKIDIRRCHTIQINDIDFGVYPGNKYLFIDADHPSSICKKDVYVDGLRAIISDLDLWLSEDSETVLVLKKKYSQLSA